MLKLKKMFSVFLILLAGTAFLSAQAFKIQNLTQYQAEDEADEYEDPDSDSEEEDSEEGDEYYEEDSEYKSNGAGDQYIKIALMGIFPLNFDDKLKTGGAAEIGYHYFVSEFFALGFDVQFGYNPTIGSNMFTFIPMFLSGTFQPYIGKFEFPITVGVGAALESYLNRNYFPGLVLKGQGGIFYRVAESWSFGLESKYMYMPQWYAKHDEWNDYGLFLSVGITARYHF